MAGENHGSDGFILSRKTAEIKVEYNNIIHSLYLLYFIFLIWYDV